MGILKSMRQLSSVIILSILAGCMLLAAPQPAAAAKVELLTNGTAENGLKGWKNPDGIWKSMTVYERISPYRGSHFFAVPGFKGANGAQTRIYQDISIGKYVGKKVTLSGYVRAWDTANTDESVLHLAFLDSQGKTLDSTSVRSSKNPAWHKISVSRTVPKKAVTARVSLYAVYYYGSEVDSYFDNVSLTAEKTEAKLSHLCLELKKGSTVQLSGILADADVASSAKWSSSKTSVASVTSTGKVKAKAKGTAMISCKLGSVTLKIQIKVK